MNELKAISHIVKYILTTCKGARNSDSLLYIKVCEILNPAVLHIPFVDVLAQLKEYGLPCFETVRRTRAKIQADCPELASIERVRRYREKREMMYREYVKE